MSTTAIIAEMIVAGAFALIWVAIFAIPRIMDPASITETHVAMLKDLATPLTLLFLMATYFLGWLVNGTAYQASRVIFLKWYSQKLLRDRSISVGYRDARLAVYQWAQPSLLTELNTDRAGMRLARCGMLNAILITVAILSNSAVPNTYTVLSLVMLAFSAILYWQRCTRYYHQVCDGYVRCSTATTDGYPQDNQTK